MQVTGVLTKIGQGSWSGKGDAAGKSVLSVIEIDGKSYYNIQVTDLIFTYLETGKTYTILLQKALVNRHLLAIKGEDGRVITWMQSMTMFNWIMLAFVLLVCLIFSALFVLPLPFYLALLVWIVYGIVITKKFSAQHGA